MIDFIIPVFLFLLLVVTVWMCMWVFGMVYTWLCGDLIIRRQKINEVRKAWEDEKE